MDGDDVPMGVDRDAMREAAVRDLVARGLPRGEAEQIVHGTARPVALHAVQVQLLSVCRSVPPDLLADPGVMAKLADGYVVRRGVALMDAGAPVSTDAGLAGIVPAECDSVPLFEDAVHAALRAGDHGALVGDPVPPRATAVGYVFDPYAEDATWRQARRFLVLAAPTSAALHGALHSQADAKWPDGRPDMVEDQTVLVRYRSVAAAHASLRALPVACTAVLRAAYAYMRAVGLLYDAASGAMCVLPLAERPRPAWTGPYAWSTASLRLRTTRALAAAELATVLLDDAGGHSPWRAWSLLCATYLVRAWLERLAAEDTSRPAQTVRVPPFVDWFAAGTDTASIVVSMWAATEWLSCGLAWSRHGLDDDAAPWTTAATGPNVAAAAATGAYLSCPLCDLKTDVGAAFFFADAGSSGPRMAHGGSLGAWRALWLEARAAAAKAPPTPLASRLWKEAQSEFDRALRLWSEHCLAPASNCVRATGNGHGLHLKPDAATRLRPQTLVREVHSSLDA